MTQGGANVPLVIQQIGKAQLVQESVQRAPEIAQHNAQVEGQAAMHRAASQVQATERGETGNRVRTREKENRKDPPERSSGRKKTGQAEEKSAGGSGAGGILDIIA